MSQFGFGEVKNCISEPGPQIYLPFSHNLVPFQTSHADGSPTKDKKKKGGKFRMPSFGKKKK
jgi:hypothetical protein